MTASLVRFGQVGVLAAALGFFSPVDVLAQSARDRYTEAQAREAAVREALAASNTAAATTAVDDARAVIRTYDAFVRRYPVSGYSDNALMNAAVLSDDLFQRFGQAKDHQTALRFYRRVGAEYPASSLTRQAEQAIVRLEENNAAAEPAAGSAAPSQAQAQAQAQDNRATLTSIDRTVLPEVVRVTLALDREVTYHDETLTGPARIFFDLKGVRAAPSLVDSVLRFPTDIVRQIRIGRHPNSTLRVVLDLEGVGRHSVYTLYNPFRVVIDCEPSAAAAKAIQRAAPPPARTMVVDSPPVVMSVVPEPKPPVANTPPAEIESGPPPPPTPAPASVAPEAPNANRAGGFSIARQLGLGVSRIVIDPGHGGHDPGAQARGSSEAELTLDIALRLEQLLAKEPGIEVVLTRRTNQYIALEERTAIANRESADLFLSIHANASRSVTASGVETYFLSFAATPEAEAVAARENSANAGEMHNLPDIIRAIALNNKLDESRDLAGMVQEALVTRLRRSNSGLRNLGVKKAPFVVLIGAGMPSVLAEVSFMTNKQELQLLKTPAYRQRIAEALHAAVMRYRRSLKKSGSIASQ